MKDRSVIDRIGRMLLCVALLITTLPMGAISADTTAEADPFEGYTPISTKAELDAVRYDLTGKYYLTGDIVFSEEDFAKDGEFYNEGTGWQPISSFSGTFDGNNFSVKNLYIHATQDIGEAMYIGLFGSTTGTIQNLGMEDSSIEVNVTFESDAQSVYVGGIAAYRGTVAHCYNTGDINVTVTSDAAEDMAVYAGGISGWGSTITDCYNTGDVTASANIQNQSRTYTATTRVGGIAGGTTEVSGCHNIGEITATSSATKAISYSGGIVGAGATITNCYNMGAVTANSDGTDLTSCARAGGIDGGQSATSGYAKLSASYNSGYVKANASHTAYVGGLRGHNYGSVADCYNTGTVDAMASTIYKGGIVGESVWTSVNFNGNSISNCYNTGIIQNLTTSSSGVIFGKNDPKVTVSNCYYLEIDNMSSYTTTSATKCTADQMKQQSTFKGFNFGTVWTMEGNEDYFYPELQAVEMIFYKKLESLSLTTLPDKVEYLEGKDQLDLSGGKLTAHYDNGTTAEIDLAEATVSGFDNTKVGNQTLFVSYGGFVDTFKVEVIAKSISGIEVTTLPTKIEYLQFEEDLDLSGGKLTVYYNNDTSEVIDLSEAVVNGFDKNTLSEQTLMVFYEGEDCSFTVKVVNHALVDIVVTTMPAKLTYSEGESFSPDGMVVTAYYADNTNEVITDYTIDGYTSTPGRKTIVVAYSGKTDIFEVTVLALVPDAITSSVYRVSENDISKVAAGTTVEEFLSNLNETEYVKIFDGENEAAGSALVKTGMQVKLMDNDTVKRTYTLIVAGDVDGDGTVSASDALMALQVATGKVTLSDHACKAAEVDAMGDITASDALMILQFATKKIAQL